jgi:four helix bundle protein
MVEEELDETAHWLDIIMEIEVLPRKRVTPLYEECIELLKIISRSIITMKQKLLDSKW